MNNMQNSAPIMKIPNKLLNTTGTLYSPNTSINKPMSNQPLGKVQTQATLMANTYNSLSAKGRMKMKGGQMSNINNLINNTSRPGGV